MRRSWIRLFRLFDEPVFDVVLSTWFYKALSMVDKKMFHVNRLVETKSGFLLPEKKSQTSWSTNSNKDKSFSKLIFTERHKRVNHFKWFIWLQIVDQTNDFSNYLASFNRLIGSPQRRQWSLLSDRFFQANRDPEWNRLLFENRVPSTWST